MPDQACVHVTENPGINLVISPKVCSMSPAFHSGNWQVLVSVFMQALQGVFTAHQLVSSSLQRFTGKQRGKLTCVDKRTKLKGGGTLSSETGGESGCPLNEKTQLLQVFKKLFISPFLRSKIQEHMNSEISSMPATAMPV